MVPGVKLKKYNVHNINLFQCTKKITWKIIKVTKQLQLRQSWCTILGMTTFTRLLMLQHRSLHDLYTISSTSLVTLMTKSDHWQQVYQTWLAELHSELFFNSKQQCRCTTKRCKVGSQILLYCHLYFQDESIIQGQVWINCTNKHTSDLLDSPNA